MSTSKRSAGRGIGSGADPFASARLKLTLLYLAIITAIVVVLSFSLYGLHSTDVSAIEHRRHARGLAEEGRFDDSPYFGEYVESLGRTIVWADVITIVVGGALSYLLAARTLRPVKASVEAEQKFFANAAHDLRTPLAVMRTEAEVALRSRPLSGEEGRRVIESSLEEIQRMSTMIEQMLSLAGRGGSRPSARSVFQPLDLAELARGAVAKMARRAEERGVRLTADAADPARVKGDAFSVERSLYNVLENAISYTPAGGSVSVHVRHQGAHVLVRVSDTGIGISAEDLPHVAEAFYRGDRARSVHAGGAGLGLTIVSAAMDEHRGTLQIESRPGEGTTVFLRFPAA
jgi:signal transduction histidine kinase